MTSRPVVPPTPGMARNSSFPTASTRRLSNGLLVVVLSDDRLPQVNLRLGLRRGRIHDPDENSALLSLTAEMLPMGACGQTAQEIAETLDHYAIQFESSVGLESSYLAWEALTPNLEASCKLISTLVLQPDFPDFELQRLKSRWKSSLLQLRSQPSYLAGERARFTLYPDHPLNRYGIELTDVEESSRRDLKESYATHFSPLGSLLLCSGAIDIEDASRLAEEFFGDWSISESRESPLPQLPPFEPGRIDLVHRPGSVQSRVVVSGKAPARSSPDLTDFKLANQILGGSASSRLFLNLREEKGLTYGAYSRLTTFNQDGLFQAAADVRSDAVALALQETLVEIRGIYSRPPDETEMSRARSEIIGSFIRQMETSAGVGSLELNRRLFDLPDDYYKNYIPDLLAIAPESMLDSASQYLNADQVLITVVGDADQVRKDLAQLGNLYTWDANGLLLEEPD